MKHTIEELQFAATVRAIAISLQAAAATEEGRLHTEASERPAAREAWKLANPLCKFIAPALVELESVAGMLFPTQ